MKENKQISFDNITIYRVVAMTMVILYHCTCYYSHPTWPFGEGPYNPILKIATMLMGGTHMPIFVFISGYLYWLFRFKGKYKDLFEFYKVKILRILVPYFTVGGGILLIFSNIYNCKSLLYGVCHLWFLLMLFGLFILSPLLWRLLESVKNDRIATILVLSSFLIYPIFNSIALLQITKVFYFLPYFALGYLLLRRGVKTLYTDLLFWLFLIGSITLLFVVCPRSIFIDKVIRQYASFVIVIMLSLIPNVTITKKFKTIIDNISYNSMGIYLFHQALIGYFLLIPAVKELMDKTNCYICSFMLFVFVFLLSWFISVVFNHYKLTSVLIGSKFK